MKLSFKKLVLFVFLATSCPLLQEEGLHFEGKAKKKISSQAKFSSPNFIDLCPIAESNDSSESLTVLPEFPQKASLPSKIIFLTTTSHSKKVRQTSTALPRAPPFRT